MKYYPPLAQLIGQAALPPDVGPLSGFNASIEQILDELLQGVGFKDLVISQSPDGDVRFCSLAIVSKELGFKLPGTDISFLFFPGEDASGEANIPVAFEWRWGIKRYVADFEAALFSRSPGAFFDLLLKLANITEAEFLDGIVTVFFGSPDPYTLLIGEIKSMVIAYGDGSKTPPDPSSDIPAKASGIVTALDALIGDLQAPNPPFPSSIEHIMASFEAIADSVGAELDICQLAFEALTRDVVDIDEKLRALLKLFNLWLDGFALIDVEELLIPQFDLAITQLPVALEFPRNWLVPLDSNGEPKPTPARSQLRFNAGAVRYSTRTGLAFEGQSSFDFTKSMIGKTGLTLEIDNCKVDFSRTSNIPEADAAGYPVDFVGVFVEYIEIGLPKKWFAKNQADPNDPMTLGIVGRNMLIGTGGITGEIDLEVLLAGKPQATKTGPPAQKMLEFTLGKKPAGGGARQGFKVGFSLFHMKFRQNVLLESKIKGELTIPKFQAQPIGVELYIAADGDFRLTASSSPPRKFEVKDAFIFKCSKVAVGKDDDRVYLETSGELSFENNSLIGSLLKTPIHIEKFLINSDGSFELEGGSIPLPSSATIKVGPAKIAITALHFGAHEQVHQGVLRKYRYWGFDGGVSVNPGGVDCRGDGIKFYFTVDGKAFHSFLRIEGIGIDLVIPGTASKDQAVLILSGYLSLKDPEYLGSISFSLPKVKIAGGGTMRYNTAYPAWGVDVWLELPMPILVGSTGLGIYGFRGLFGLRYIASKKAIGPPPLTNPPPLPEDASWGDYYRAAQPRKGLHLQKLITPDKSGGAKNPFSIGAGVSLATAQDKGKAFSSQLFLLVSLPDLIILEGRADVLAKQRVGLTDGEPPYYAYLALSRESIELGAGVNYLIPKDTGETLNLSAVFEAAYFWRNSSAWYVHFGTKAKPMTARILDMLDGYAYLMLSASGIEAGAGVHFEFSKSYGPVSVDAYAYLDTWAYLSFERSQAGGGIALGGHVDVTFMKVGFYISLDAGLTVEAPTPYRVAGYVEICVTVNLKIKSFSKCVDLNFEWQRSNQVDMSPVAALIAPPAAPAPPPAVAVHMMSGETYPVEFSTNPNMVPTALNDWAIPLDAYIDVKLGKRVDPLHATGARIGGATTPPAGQIETLPPRYGSRIVEHRYSLERVALEVLGPNGWRDYRPYEAIAGEGFVTAVDAQDIASMPVGLWQKQDEGYGQIRFLALTPFSFVGPTDGHRPEELGVTSTSLYCVEPKRTEHCLTWREPRALASGQDHFRDGVLYRVDDAATGSVPVGPSALAASFSTSIPTACNLVVGEGGRATFLLPADSVSCRVKVSSSAPQVVLRFQRLKPTGPVAGPKGPVWPYSPPEYEDVRTMTVSRAALAQPIVYLDPAEPIRRILLETPVPDRRTIAMIEETIARRQDDWYRADERQRPAIRKELDTLAIRLREEHARTCVDGPRNGRDDKAAEERRRAIAALNAQLAALRAEIEAQAGRYDSLCASRFPRDRAGDAAAPLQPPAPPGRLAQAAQASLALLQAPIQALQVRRIWQFPWPPMSEKACAQLAAEIAALERKIEEIRRRLAELEREGSGSGRGETKEAWACATFVEEICWLSEEDWSYNQALPDIAAIAADYDSMRQAVETAVAPIWRSHQTYRITLVLRDTVSAGSSTAPTDGTFYIHFRTRGPIGEFRPFPQGNPLEDPRPDSPENFLKYYIDRNRSFPDPGGDLLYAKPLFYRDVTLDLRLARPHALHFFANWPDYGLGPCHYEMAIRVKDPAEAVPSSTDPDYAAAIVASPILGEQKWNPVPAPPTPELKMLNNLHDPLAGGASHATACLSQGTKGPVKPAALAISTKLGDLRPNKLYTAVVLNRRLDVTPPTEAEVHRYPFKTSRYPDFAAQIGSCVLDAEPDSLQLAVYAVGHDLASAAAAPAAYASALAIVKREAPPDPAYPDYFDQLLYGRLKLAPLPPPATLEFNFVTNALAGDCYGLWIRGPEPLNDPRAPRPARQAAVALHHYGVLRTDTQVILSKDGCQAFVMIDSGPMPTGDLSVAFGLLAPDGQSVAETVVTGTLTMPQEV